MEANIQQQIKAHRVRVWDLPTRVFHWSLVLCVIGAVVSGNIAGNAMVWHFRFGFCILTLLLFRIVWGFVGNRYARFSSFLPNPLAAWKTLRGAASNTLGHNPLGAWSVYAFLVMLSVQAITGLFSNDDIANEGPWAVKIAKDLSDALTSWHKGYNKGIIVGLMLLHIAAILYYRYVKKERLLKAMITGDKEVVASESADETIRVQSAEDTTALRLRALAVLAICAAVVWFAVTKL